MSGGGIGGGTGAGTGGNCALTGCCCGYATTDIDIININIRNTVAKVDVVVRRKKSLLSTNAFLLLECVSTFVILHRQNHEEFEPRDNTQ